jgi:cysteinyl-tRNA synthetase
MRDLVCRISRYAKAGEPGFLIVPQNGLGLLTEEGEPEGTMVTDYVNAIDGIGQENLNFGYDGMNEPTPRRINRRLCAFMERAGASGKSVLVTDYCCDKRQVDHALTVNKKQGFLTFAADSRELDRIPAYPQPPFKRHCKSFSALGDAKNFLYFLNMSQYPDRDAFLRAVRETDYDVIITDAFFHGTTPFTPPEIKSLKVKACGGKRIILAYMSIGEAEDYRYYWKTIWKMNRPAWLDRENEDWEGNFKVRYWMDGWQEILFGNEDAYLDRLMEAGFDGVYLDIIDAFEYFEELDGR